MKKRMAAFVATGVMTLGAFAGTVASANASVVRPNSFYWEGAFANAASCESYVRQINEWGVWDCEYYSNPYFSSNGAGWYATSPSF